MTHPSSCSNPTATDIKIIKSYFTIPDKTQIGRCLSPTHINPLFCTNLQARHQSSKLNPGTNFEICQDCTMIGQAWQKDVLEAFAADAEELSKVSMKKIEAEWVERAEMMLIRKPQKEVKKTGCLCERAAVGIEVEGDRLCGGPEIVEEVKESKSQSNGYS